MNIAFDSDNCTDIQREHLIAAAPDMYHALQDLIAYLGVDVDNGLDELLTNARAAIAKATGGEA